MPAYLPHFPADERTLYATRPHVKDNARYFRIRLRDLAHENDPRFYGQLADASGPWAIEKIQRMLPSLSIDHCRNMMRELDGAGVLCRMQDGTIHFPELIEQMRQWERKRKNQEQYRRPLLEESTGLSPPALPALSNSSTALEREPAAPVQSKALNSHGQAWAVWLDVWSKHHGGDHPAPTPAWISGLERIHATHGTVKMIALCEEFWRRPLRTKNPKTFCAPNVQADLVRRVKNGSGPAFDQDKARYEAEAKRQLEASDRKIAEAIRARRNGDAAAMKLGEILGL